MEIVILCIWYTDFYNITFYNVHSWIVETIIINMTQPQDHEKQILSPEKLKLNHM